MGTGRGGAGADPSGVALRWIPEERRSLNLQPPFIVRKRLPASENNSLAMKGCSAQVREHSGRNDTVPPPPFPTAPPLGPGTSSYLLSSAPFGYRPADVRRALSKLIRENHWGYIEVSKLRGAEHWQRIERRPGTKNGNAEHSLEEDELRRTKQSRRKCRHLHSIIRLGLLIGARKTSSEFQRTGLNRPSLSSD